MLKQKLNLKTYQKLSPQQIQLMKLVQLPVLAFEQKVKETIENNPALEEDENSNDNLDYNLDHIKDKYYNNTSNFKDDSYRLNKQLNYYEGLSFIDYLLNQLSTFILSEKQYKIAKFIIGNIDDDGYLRRDISSIVNDLSFNQNIDTNINEVNFLLENYIQKLDPIGVGAKSLQDCLLIQLNNKKQTKIIKLCKLILEESFDSFSKKHFNKLINRYNIDDKLLKKVFQEIEKLNPKPGKSYSYNNYVYHIIPDFIVDIDDSGNLNISLNERNNPNIKLSSFFIKILDKYKIKNDISEEDRKVINFIKNKIESAKWFIDAVIQRKDTLMSIMKCIINFQKDYFITGDETKIKPMILKDISKQIKVDISTVSRVANSKYINTPYGNILVKNLFSEAIINDNGDEISTREIKSILKEIIDRENKKNPLTDDKLAIKLNNKGYKIARRTIAKYREQMNIPVARLRKII